MVMSRLVGSDVCQLELLLLAFHIRAGVRLIENHEEGVVQGSSVLVSEPFGRSTMRSCTSASNDYPSGKVDRERIRSVAGHRSCSKTRACSNRPWVIVELSASFPYEQ